MDEIGPGEGRLDSGGIKIPLKTVGKGGVAQVPAGSPSQATTCGQSAPEEVTVGAFAEKASSKKNERKTFEATAQGQRPVVELRPAAQLTRFGIEERQFPSWRQRLTHSTCNLQKSPVLVTLQDGASHRHR